MKTDRQLTLMNPRQLREQLEIWRKKEKDCKINSKYQKICCRMIEKITNEIEFKELLLAGLLYMDEHNE